MAKKAVSYLKSLSPALMAKGTRIARALNNMIITVQ